MLRDPPTDVSDIQELERSKFGSMGAIPQYVVDAFANTYHNSLDSVCKEIGSKWTSPLFATYFLIIRKSEYVFNQQLQSALNYRESRVNDDYIIVIVDEWQKDERSIKAKP